MRMYLLDQISVDLERLDAKREIILKTLQSDHQITPQWEEYREISCSIKISSENFCKELESKEREINDRFKELEIIEIERLENMGPGRTGFSSGEKLLTFLIDHENELEKMADDVHRVLRISADPTKLVLNAVNERLTLETENGVEKRCIVVLLDQLMRVDAICGRVIRERAKTIAKEWKIRVEREGEDDLEVLGFLMFLGVYKLVCEFDPIEVKNLLESVSQHKQAPDLRQLLELVDKSHEVKLEQHKDSSFLDHFPELKSFCFNMDGKGLLLFLCLDLQAHDSMRGAISDALGLASDSAKLVLDVIPAFFRPNDYIEGLFLPQVRKCCILLLELLATIIPPVIETGLTEEALKLGFEWKQRVVAQKYSNPGSVYGLLQFIATYRLMSSFDDHELLDILVRVSDYKTSPPLCRALGLLDKAPVLIENLLKKTKVFEAMEYICAFELFVEFPPKQLLMNHWSYQMKRFIEGKRSQKEILEKEMELMRNIVKFIIDHKLERFSSPVGLKAYIRGLEKQNATGAYLVKTFDV